MSRLALVRRASRTWRRFLTDTLSLPVWLWWMSNVGFLLIGVAAGSFL